MIPSEKAEFPLQRRQFGRRDISRAGSVTMPGGATAECRIVNVSEGGALLDFPGGLVPAKSFKLAIDGVAFTLACEPRHSREAAVGVRFLNEADGVRLIAQLFPGTNASVAGELPRRPEAAMVPVAVRDLRQRVLAAFSDKPAAAPENATIKADEIAPPG